MTKSELQELARFGVRRKLEIMEREVREMFRMFPEEFASATPPVLLAPESKVGGNDWPVFTATNGNGNGHTPDARAKISTAAKASWTPERRAMQAQLMKKTMRRAAAKKKAAAKTTKPASRVKPPHYVDTQKWGTFGWQRAHDYLLTQDQRQAKVADVVKGAKLNSSASFITSIDNHADVFEKTAPGIYRLKKIVEHTT